MNSEKKHTPFHLVVLLAGIVAASTSVLFIKASTINPVLLASYRLIAATIFLLPLFVRDVRRHHAVWSRRDVLTSILPGIILGLHFITWITGARLTPAANASLIVCLVPLVTPFLLAAIVHEKLTRPEIIATCIALSGVLWLGYADYTINISYVRGDSICFGSMLLFALYLVLARRNRHVASVWLYVVPLYAIAGVFCFICALFVTSPITTYTGLDIIAIFGLALIPTVLGHSSLNYAMKFFRGQVVSVLAMGEFIVASVLAWFIFKEVPHISFYITSLAVIISAAIILRTTFQRADPDGVASHSTGQRD